MNRLASTRDQALRRSARPAHPGPVARKPAAASASLQDSPHLASNQAIQRELRAGRAGDAIVRRAVAGLGNQAIQRLARDRATGAQSTGPGLEAMLGEIARRVRPSQPGPGPAAVIQRQRSEIPKPGLGQNATYQALQAYYSESILPQIEEMWKNPEAEGDDKILDRVATWQGQFTKRMEALWDALEQQHVQDPFTQPIPTAGLSNQSQGTQLALFHVAVTLNNLRTGLNASCPKPKEERKEEADQGKKLVQKMEVGTEGGDMDKAGNAAQATCLELIAKFDVVSVSKAEAAKPKDYVVKLGTDKRKRIDRQGPAYGGTYAKFAVQLGDFTYAGIQMQADTDEDFSLDHLKAAFLKSLNDRAYIRVFWGEPD